MPLPARAAAAMRRARRAAAVAAGLTLASYPAVTLAAPAPHATAFAGTPAVGALFQVSGTRLRHFCTAAVVRSPQGNLGITAAHCLQGRRLGASGDVIFAPGYRAGRFPFGKWRVMSAFTDRNWRRTRDPDDDVAFLVIGARGRRIEWHTGAEILDTSARLPVLARVIGYPDKASRPVTCTAKARVLHRNGYSQLVFRCGGYTAGTSGGPFLVRVRKRTGAGEIIGVIGGYQQGGDSPRVSYSARFGGNVAALYRHAARSG